MKLKLIENSGPISIDEVNLLSNKCQTNTNLCKAFSIPIKNENDLKKFYWQVEFPFRPQSISYKFTTNCGTSSNPIIAYPDDYSLFQLSNGNWLLTWHGQSNIPVGSGYTCFTPIVEAYPPAQQGFTYPYYAIGDTYCIEDCVNIDTIETCYKIGASAASNYDANGVYYGAPYGAQVYGNSGLVYKHIYNVRNLTIKSSGLKTTITKNNFKSTSTVIERENLLNLEDQIPYWYAKYLQVLFSNGQFSINSNTSNLYEAEELNFKEISLCCETYHIQVSIKDTYLNALSCSSCLVCETTVYSINNLSDTSLQIEILNFNSTSSYSVSLDGGLTFPIIGITTNLISIGWLIPGTNYDIVIRQRCSNNTVSLTDVTQITTKCYCVKIYQDLTDLTGKHYFIDLLDCNNNLVDINTIVNPLTVDYEIDTPSTTYTLSHTFVSSGTNHVLKSVPGNPTNTYVGCSISQSSQLQFC